MVTCDTDNLEMTYLNSLSDSQDVGVIECISGPLSWPGDSNVRDYFH